MILNEFLAFKLGVVFEDKYNHLAVKEVYNNPESYPLIYDPIVDLISFDENNRVKKIQYESGYFDCDDPELCADEKATFELYRAFVRTFARKEKNSAHKVRCISFGTEYLKNPLLSNIMDPYLNYVGRDSVSVYSNKKVFFDEIFYPNNNGENPIGNRKTEKHEETFFGDNKTLLATVTDGFFRALEVEDWFPRLDENYFYKEEISKEENLYGYAYGFYEIEIGRNIVKVFTDEVGFDPLGAVRSPIFKSLSKEELYSAASRKIRW